MTALSLHDKEEGSGQVEAEGMLLGDRADQPLHPLPFALRIPDPFLPKSLALSFEILKGTIPIWSFPRTATISFSPGCDATLPTGGIYFP